MKQHRFEEPLTKGQARLNVSNEVGRIKVLPHDGRSIIIDAETRHMELTVNRGDNTITVRAEIDKTWRNPLKRFANRLNQQPKANLIIHVPADCEVIAKTVTGQLIIRDVDAPITGRVITGQTRLTNLGGPIYAKTITGDLQYHGILADTNHRFETTTGTIQLNLTQEPNARLDIRTVTGGIRCDFPLTRQIERRHVVGARLTDTLGSGKGHINTRVTTGSVQLGRA